MDGTEVHQPTSSKAGTPTSVELTGSRTGTSSDPTHEFLSGTRLPKSPCRYSSTSSGKAEHGESNAGVDDGPILST